MRRLAGQATRAVLWLLHGSGSLALLLLVLLCAGASGLAWRVAQGPLEMPFLAALLARAANAEAARHGETPIRIAIGGAALTWEGFRLGIDRPLDIRLTHISILDPAHGQRVAVPRAEISLGLGALLFGRIEPRAIEIDGASMVIQRTASGKVSLHLDDASPVDKAPLDEVGSDHANEGESGIDAIVPLIAELSRPDNFPAAVNLSPFRQLRRLLIRNATITVVDRRLDAIWHASSAAIDLRRRAMGGVEGSAEFVFQLDADAPVIKLSGALDPAVPGSAAEGALRLHADLTGLKPASLARHVPSLLPLAAIDTVLAGVADAQFSPDLRLIQARVDLRAGPGSATIGPTTVPLDGARLTAEGNERNATLTAFELRLGGHDGGPISTLSATGTLQCPDARLRATLALAVDHVEFADLAQLWPAGLASPARSWVIGNITAGTARNAQIAIGLEVNEDGSDLDLTQATGTLLGEGLTVHWLRPVPPIENGFARLVILNPDTLEIVIAGGRQALATGRLEGGLRVQSGSMRISGLLHKDQIGEIDARIAGSIVDAVALLREQRLHLFDRFPIDLKDPSGQVAGRLSLTVPLEDKVRMEQIPIRAVLHLQDAHLRGIAAGRDLDHGNIDLTASADGLKLSGEAEIATIPASLDADIDFRSGPPGQVLQRITVSARPSVKQLSAVGLTPGDAITGTLGLRAVVTERRDGTGDIAINADLTEAQLSVTPLGWRKPAGSPAKATARVRLRRDRVTGIEDIAVDGTGIGLRASAVFSDGLPDRVSIDRLDLGRTRARGSVRFPGAAGQPIEAELGGTVLDLAPVLSRKTDPRPVDPEATQGSGWNVDARFDRVETAGATALLGVIAHARSDGAVLRELDMQGLTGPNAPVRINIIAVAGGRRLTASAANAGDLLRALDVIDTMQDGKLTVNGMFDDAQRDHPLTGAAEIESFRIRRAPVFGRLLQAMTLYGLVEVMQGDGLGFNDLVAPFRLAGDVLELNDARAFSASLGLTAKGRIDLRGGQIDVQGTIVPAYFFNSLLGNLPLVGRLFSPEPGGGLFAASYGVSGALADPAVRVNPLSALTPGFLRGLFGIF